MDDKIHDRALRLLGARQRTCKEMRDRLTRAGFEAEATDAEVARLLAARLLDDEQFAREFVRHSGAKGAGTRLIRSQLLQKGVARDLVDDALGAMEAAHNEDDRALALAEARVPHLRNLDAGTLRRRLVEFLTRRGYSWETAARAADTAISAATLPGPTQG